MKDKLITLSNRQDIYREIDEYLGSNLDKRFRISLIDQGKKRSLSANAQQHLWYSQISNHYGDRGALEVKNFCKHAFGLPLLLNSAKHADKMEFLLDKLDYYKHSFESQMKLVQCLEVTSLLSTAESKIYMEQMIFYFNDLGVSIQFKDK
ncbi:hypothetical protein [Pseudoalteromonas sp.]|uniref:hypothetical protein n=1 Tax=Pseudoalteromonas sp. TaxID=53249 RepID=UPI00356A8262